jgi:hypothetical protein
MTEKGMVNKARATFSTVAVVAPAAVDRASPA